MFEPKTVHTYTNQGTECTSCSKMYTEQLNSITSMTVSLKLQAITVSNTSANQLRYGEHFHTMNTLFVSAVNCEYLRNKIQR